VKAAYLVLQPLRRLAGFITVETEDNENSRGSVKRFTDESGAPAQCSAALDNPAQLQTEG
jgi:hypothetical protein